LGNSGDQHGHVKVQLVLFSGKILVHEPHGRYPNYGRDLKYATGEIGLAGHWIKLILHYMFHYKAKLRLGWQLIPE